MAASTVAKGVPCRSSLCLVVTQTIPATRLNPMSGNVARSSLRGRSQTLESRDRSLPIAVSNHHSPGKCWAPRDSRSKSSVVRPWPCTCRRKGRVKAVTIVTPLVMKAAPTRYEQSLNQSLMRWQRPIPDRLLMVTKMISSTPHKRRQTRAGSKEYDPCSEIQCPLYKCRNRALTVRPLDTW
jgi:hypothetical protein